MKRVLTLMIMFAVLFTLPVRAQTLDEGKSRWEARYNEAASLLGLSALPDAVPLGNSGSNTGFLYLIHEDIECAVYFMPDGTPYGQMLYVYAKDAPMHNVMLALICAIDARYDEKSARDVLKNIGFDAAAAGGNSYDLLSLDGWLYMLTNVSEGDEFGFMASMVREDEYAGGDGSAPPADGDIWDGLWGDDETPGDGETPAVTPAPKPTPAPKIHKI